MEEGAEGVTGTITAKFLCQPFLVKDEATTATVQVGSYQTVSNPGRTAEVTAKTESGTATVTMGGIKQSVTTTPQRLVARLQPGDNEVDVTGAAVTLTWHETRI